MASKKLSLKQAERIIFELDNQGLTSEKIGLVLKNKYGIKNFKKEYGKRISQINGKKDATLVNLRKKLKKLQKHLEKNKKDQPTKRKLITTAARIKIIEKYLQKKEGH